MKKVTTKKRSTSDSAPLNPSLHKEYDASYSSENQHGTDPMETVSVKKDEGSWWPWVWASVTVVCVIAALYLLIF